MSNNKLSLGDFKLKKSDLEGRIIAKLLKKDVAIASSENTQDKPKYGRDETHHLTKNEKAARVKALFELKKQNGIADNSNQGNQATPNKPRQNLISESSAVKNPEEEKQKNKKKEFVAKKFNSNTTKKRLSKHQKSVITQGGIGNLVVKTRFKQHSKAEKKQVKRKIRVCSAMTVYEISLKVHESEAEIKKIIKQQNNLIDIEKPIEPEIVELVIQELGHIPQLKLSRSIKDLTAKDEDNTSLAERRPPIVTIMGHVDHGKTTLIDALRNSSITAKEHGGITQHIGAYQIGELDNLITIIDTPGHAAFTAMRARGAKITDIAVLVIAADDSIKEQTVEAINHIQAAKVSMVVAVNKIDKPGANIKRVVNELLQYNVIAEELGGEVLITPVSAKDKLNLDKLKEAILLQAELQEIIAQPTKNAKGIILESKLDKKRGVLATLIIKDGTLKKGQIIVAGGAYCKVRAMIDCYGGNIEKAGPSSPIEVLGFDIVPASGDQFATVDNEKDARSIISVRLRNSHQLERSQDDIDDLFQVEKERVSFLIKADTQGSLEAVVDSINKFKIDQVNINITHKGVGAINESDVLLSSASGAEIIAFTIKVDKKITDLAKKHNVSIRYYVIIYDLIKDIKDTLSGFLPSLKEERIMGSIIVREVFNVSKTGKVAGCYVQEGLVKRGMSFRLLRASQVVYEGKIKNLRRFEKDQEEVRNGFECGIFLENYGDVKIGDTIEPFEVIETKQYL